MNRKRVSFLIILLCVLISITACARKEGPERVVATINDYDMTVEDFNYESKEVLHMGRVLGDFPVTKEDLLDALITKEILLQEAQKENLDKDRNFMKSIELYWEQTLIKNLMLKKSEEIEKKIMVYEDEINDYYNKMSPDEKKPLAEVKDEIVTRIKMKKEREFMDEWINGLRSKSRIRINKKIFNELH